MVQMTSAVSVQFHQRPLLQACCSHCSLSPCLLSLSLYCYSGVTAKMPKMIFIKLRKLIRNWAVMLSRRFMFLLKPVCFSKTIKPICENAPKHFLPDWLIRWREPGWCSGDWLILLLCNTCLLYRSACKEWWPPCGSADRNLQTQTFSGHHGYLNCCWMCKQVSFCWKVNCTCNYGWWKM